MQNKKKILSINEIEKLNINEIKELYSSYINPYQTKIFSNFSFGKEVFVKAKGMNIYTESGKKILDFTGGFGVLNHGHNNERILNVRKKFLDDNKMEVHKIVFSKYLAGLSFNLSQILENDFNRTFLCNSGAEAVEGALKIAFRSCKNKKFVLSSNKSYHGKLIATGSISGSYKEKNTFPKISNYDFFDFNDPVSLEKKIEELNNKGGVYAVVIEPYSATLLEECSNEFIEKLIFLRNKFKFKIICDEVYCAWYKCGHLFYFKKYKNFKPDIITLSKSMGGGKSSISAYVTSEKIHKEVYGSLDTALLHSTTYNGFAEECITAIEAINILIEENYNDKVKKIESLIEKKLSEIKKKFPKKIKGYRGKGSLFGIEFFSVMDNFNYLLDKVNLNSIKQKKKLVSKLYVASLSDELFINHNILTNISESDNSDFLYISPSLIVTEDDINCFFNALENILNKSINMNFPEYIFKSVINLIKKS
tara:strand:+ start:89 stop:1525 length:1437 start_codon:yes stop_codon:yes gene_type:complete